MRVREEKATLRSNVKSFRTESHTHAREKESEGTVEHIEKEVTKKWMLYISL